MLLYKLSVNYLPNVDVFSRKAVVCFWTLLLTEKRDTDNTT